MAARDEEAGGHGALALDLDGTSLLQHVRRRQQRCRHLAALNLARRARALHAARRVHGVPEQLVPRVVQTHHSRHDRSRVQTNVDLDPEAHASKLLFQLMLDVWHAVHHCERHVGAQVGVVEARVGRATHHHVHLTHGLHLVHPEAVDELVELGVDAVQVVQSLLRRHGLGERREVADLTEQHRHRSELLRELRVPSLEPLDDLLRQHGAEQHVGPHLLPLQHRLLPDQCLLAEVIATDVHLALVADVADDEVEEGEQAHVLQHLLTRLYVPHRQDDGKPEHQHKLHRHRHFEPHWREGRQIYDEHGQRAKARVVAEGGEEQDAAAQHEGAGGDRP
mmetsp:Transcript_13727/g.43906  ORF Transcript_13727/g.43906 Transcript_13727/m.43906 type:complete len:336 (-) Transcript_13727:674-1681(-)